VICVRSDTCYAGLVVLVTFILLGFHLTTTSLEYSRDNPDWNGTSEFFSLPDRHSTTDLTEISTLTGKMNTTLLIIAPERSYTDTDTAEIRRFVEVGNTMILASDDDIGDQILQKLGSSVTIHPGVLASIDRAYNDSYIVVTTPDPKHPITWNVSTLVLDRGATVTGGSSLFQSSIISWIDTDGNYRISGDESLGRRSVATVWPLGSGEVIVISDPSIFINAMLNVGDQWGNRVFIHNCISLHSSLFIEQIESRTKVHAVLSEVLYYIRSKDTLKIVIVAIVFCIISLLMWNRGKR
jgi:hypothetical protein